MKIVGSALKEVKQNRGKPRIWLQGRMPEKAGFHPGLRYEVDHVEGRSAIVLRINDDGRYVVSKKDVRGREVALIDLNSEAVLGQFAGMGAVRVVMGQDQIWILPLPFEVKAKERLERFKAELSDGGRITTAEVCHGAGVMANALHHGLKEAGMRPELLWAVELEDDALDVAMDNNDAWNDQTIPVAMPLQQLALGDDFVVSRLPKVSLLSGGLPCTAASLAGRAKKHLAKPEDDPKAGHLIAAFIALVARINPAMVSLENVNTYFTSASASILRTTLIEMGYELSEVEIDCGDYALEARVRTVLFGATKGIKVDAAKLIAPPRSVQSLADVLDDVPDDSSLWQSMDYLKVKEEKDIAAGKGFRMAVVDASSSGETYSIGTLGRGYGKVRSTECKIAHPSGNGLLRQLTVKEHARVKGIPEKLVEGVSSVTRGHELLGQSVVWPAFKELGKLIGRSLQSMNDQSNANGDTPQFALVG